MLYFLSLLQEHYSPLRVFQYITVRTFAGAGTAFLICVLAGPWVIEKLRLFRIGQYVRDDVHANQKAKQGTPTMGGLLIIGAICLSCLIWVVPGNRHVHLVLATMAYMGLVGFWDDYLKIARRQSKGLSARGKLALQLLWAMVMAFALLAHPETGDGARQLMIPFLKDPFIRDMGVLGVCVFAAAILIGSTNAVNLTDGMDGLAIGCSGSVALAYLVMCYVAGHVHLSAYLLVPYIKGAGELAVFCGCMLGACLGFLWHNCHPARVFMGDTGSLALGGSIAMVTLLIKQELVLILVGGVFVMEALSVIIQVASFKMTGKRVFAMAPIHHHFELKGWSETQVVVRFWILSIIFALLGVVTLKIR